jgi:hypothetical protein
MPDDPMPENPAPDNPIVAFNQVLSEILDVVQVAKQADRKVQRTHALHRELDQLLADLVAWAAGLMAEDDALGVSALTYMPSQAGRQPRNPWPGAPTDDQVRNVLDGLLGRLEEHLGAALAQQSTDDTRRALFEVAQGLQDHRRVLSGG